MYVRTTEVHQGMHRPRFILPFLSEIAVGGIPGFSPAEEKALRITDAFENTSWYVRNRTLSFRGLTGDFDGQGLSFGLLQWNIGTGSLQPLLREFERDHPQRFNAIFGPHVGQMRQILSQSKAEQLKWARSINDYSNPKKPRIHEPWASYFRNLGEDPAFQRIQLRHVRPRMDAAIRYARQFGLRSERGLALMFDQVTQSGPAWLTCTHKPICEKRATLIDKGRAQRQRELGRPLEERELLEIIANVVADTAKPKYRKKVRARKMTIVTGRGRVHKHDFDLEKDFGLTDQPWETAVVAVPTTAPSPTLSPTSQTSNGSLFSSLLKQMQDLVRRGQETLAIGLALAQGVRDINELTNLVFFARHPERERRKLVRGEPQFEQLSQEWLDIRNRIVRPFLAKASPAKPSTGKPAKPVVTVPYPEVNTPLPKSGPGFIRHRPKTADWSYGLPEMIAALTGIAAAWHKAYPDGPRIVIRDISRPGGGELKPHKSHQVGLDVDIQLEGERATWYKKVWKSKRSFEWKLNSSYSRSLTQELVDLIHDHPKGGLKVKFILFDDPKVSKVVKDPKSPHLNHLHVRFCAPAYFAPKVNKRYKSCP